MGQEAQGTCSDVFREHVHSHEARQICHLPSPRAPPELHVWAQGSFDGRWSHTGRIFASAMKKSWISLKKLISLAIVTLDQWRQHPRWYSWKKLLLRLSYRNDVTRNCLLFIRSWNICSVACSTVGIRRLWPLRQLGEDGTYSFLLHFISIALQKPRTRQEPDLWLQTERPYIQCLASSEQSITLDLDKKHHMVYQMRATLEYSPIL